jgi:hypothetical protein
MQKIKLSQRIKLMAIGYYEDDGKYYTYCKKHGITEAVMHGYMDYIDCKKCLMELWK